eukprot:GHRR01036791.1.p1 GENE.GHRR01036791.1~~GHRR01036791.1.p1  ORF type:complete len:137 (+),score=41.08 GHRR01036791.1:41-451(+)
MQACTTALQMLKGGVCPGYRANMVIQVASGGGRVLAWLPPLPLANGAAHVGGAAATRRLVWSRFRLTQTLRDDGPLLTACSFLRGFELLVAGTSNGELRLHDAYSGETVELVDAHTAPVNLLQVGGPLGPARQGAA